MLFSFKPYQIFDFFGVKDDEALGWSSDLVGFISPLLLVASISTLLVTNAILPPRRLSWINKVFAHVRKFPTNTAEHGVELYKKNQFAVGQPDFNLMAFWLVFLPGMLIFITPIHHIIDYASDPEHRAVGETEKEAIVKRFSDYAGWAGTLLLSVFLIPVSRHSVLLVAMNWSPIHALRIHIWAGYLAFFLIFLHGILIVGVWFKWAPGAIYEEFIPSKECWSGMFPEGSRCSWQYYNFTGMIAFIFLNVVWVSSFNWFRRKWYRLFYILHVVCGTLALLGSIWHYEYIALYLLPSIVYYLASTMPTFVQAVASRFRGGVKILQVVVLDGAGDCLEIRVSIDPTAQAVLSSTHPSKYMKLCVPGISLVWHPFTVYNHPNDPTTLRMMFRPIGPFTKALRSSLVNPDKRPITLVDGFYRGSDHCQQALMCHDHVTIVAGGVAITPFISMIFAVLKELSLKTPEGSTSKQEQPVLQSLTLIWSCRELGLLSFVKHNYLDDMSSLASTIKDFEVKIKIHYTGSENKSTAEGIDNDEALGTEENGREAICKHEVRHSGSHMYKKVDHQTISFIVENDAISNDVKGIGHALELARMMPARFSRMIWNLPYFAVYTSSLWLGFHFIFFNYDSVSSVRDRSKEVYITVLVVAFFLGVGIIIEVSVLLFRKYWPAPRYDDFGIVSSSEINPKEEQFVANDIEKTSEMIQYYVGRPSSEHMLADASQASAPGLFVCGPVGMVQLLHSAARIENSAFGCLTRYAIYEESFEM